MAMTVERAVPTSDVPAVRWEFERRHDERYSVSLSGWIVSPVRADRPECRVELDDLSLSGALVKGGSRFGRGESVALVLERGALSPVHVRAAVVRRDSTRAGLLFSDGGLSPDGPEWASLVLSGLEPTNLVLLKGGEGRLLELESRLRDEGHRVAVAKSPFDVLFAVSHSPTRWVLIDEALESPEPGVLREFFAEARPGVTGLIVSDRLSSALRLHS